MASQKVGEEQKSIPIATNSTTKSDRPSRQWRESLGADCAISETGPYSLESEGTYFPEDHGDLSDLTSTTARCAWSVPTTTRHIRYSRSAVELTPQSGCSQTCDVSRDVHDPQCENCPSITVTTTDDGQWHDVIAHRERYVRKKRSSLSSASDASPVGSNLGLSLSPPSCGIKIGMGRLYASSTTSEHSDQDDPMAGLRPSHRRGSTSSRLSESEHLSVPPPVTKTSSTTRRRSGRRRKGSSASISSYSGYSTTDSVFDDEENQAKSPTGKVKKAINRSWRYFKAGLTLLDAQTAADDAPATETKNIVKDPRRRYRNRTISL